MFYSIFNYTKLFCWSLILFLNYNYTKKYNLDLLNIVLYNIQDTNALAVKCIQKIIPYLKMSNYDKDVIDLLSQTYEENIFHSDKDTLKIYKNDFHKDFLSEYKIVDKISSGSIGQVYIISKDNHLYAMKVIHPNVKYHLNLINRMIWLFDLQKYIFFELDVFIENFTNETDFLKETENMKIFYDKYKDNDRIIIPNVFKSSKNIIIMDYIPGEKINELNSYEMSKYINLTVLFCNNNKYILNKNHGDLHLGNFKKYKDNNIVIYDFGFCFTVKDKKLIDILDFFYFYVTVEKTYLKKMKYTYLECVEYIVDYHLDDNDNLEKYRESFTEYFINHKIENLSDLAIKTIKFFIVNNIRTKIEYLNLIINYYYISTMYDSNNLDLLSFCETYEIFKEYQEILKGYIFYGQKTSIEKNPTLYNELKSLL